MTNNLTSGNCKRAETKHERDSRRVKSRHRSKQWYISRVQQREQKHVVENYIVTATRLKYPTVTSSSADDIDVELKEQSRRVIEKPRIDLAVLVQQTPDIGTTILTIARTCHLDNISESPE